LNYYNEFDSYAAQWLRNLIHYRHLQNPHFISILTVVTVETQKNTNFLESWDVR